MNLAAATMMALAAAFWAYAWWRRDGSHRRGFLQGWHTLRSIFPLLLLAFTTVGYVTVLLSHSGLQDWMGPGSGWKGLLLAQGIGMLIPGGPYVVLPLIGSLQQLGTGLGPTVTLLTSWASLSLLNAVWEIRFLGWRFTVIRWILMLVFPLTVGFLVQTLFEDVP